MESIVILFGSDVTGNGALEEMERRIPQDDFKVRVVEVNQGHPLSPEKSVIGLPVPAHGGAVPVFVGVADLDLSDEERDYIFNRATTDMMILEISVPEEYVDDVKRIASMHNGQFFQKEDED